MGFFFLVFILGAFLIYFVIPITVVAIVCRKGKQEFRGSHLSGANRASNSLYHVFPSENYFYQDNDWIFQNQQQLEQERIFGEMNETAIRMHNEAVMQHEQMFQQQLENQFIQDTHMAQDFYDPFF